VGYDAKIRPTGAPARQQSSVPSRVVQETVVYRVRIGIEIVAIDVLTLRKCRIRSAHAPPIPPPEGLTRCSLGDDAPSGGRNPHQFCQKMRARELRFWFLAVQGNPPPPRGSDLFPRPLSQTAKADARDCIISKSV
jgi:hypothetical protein